MAENQIKKSGFGSSEKITQERLYALIFRLNEEVKGLSSQVKALRNLIEGNENR